MNALTSYLRHLFVTGILIFIEKLKLPIDGAEDAANVIALAIIGTLSWLFVKYAAPLIKTPKGSGLALFALASALAIGMTNTSCSNQPTGYIADVSKHRNESGNVPDKVTLTPSEVTPIGGQTFTFSGGVELLTDHGTISATESGVSGTIVVDQRSGK